MMKRIISCLLVCFLLLGLCPAALAARVTDRFLHKGVCRARMQARRIHDCNFLTDHVSYLLFQFSYFDVPQLIRASAAATA